VCALQQQLWLGLLVSAPVAGAGVEVAQQRAQALHHLGKTRSSSSSSSSSGHKKASAQHRHCAIYTM
jgi:hypothetical protein